MEVVVSNEVINTVCNSLRASKHSLEWQLTVSIPNGKVNPNKKDVIEHQLDEVEEALRVFECITN